MQHSKHSKESISLSDFKAHMRECTEKATYNGTIFLVRKYRVPSCVFLPIAKYEQLIEMAKDHPEFKDNEY